MNKKHWNTVVCDGSIHDEQIREMINESFFLVLKGMTKAEQKEVDQASETEVNVWWVNQ